MNAEARHTCPSCGNELSGATESCPVCMLREALAGWVESGESSASEGTVKPTPEQAAQRFEHYELLKGEDGKPVELSRGAMGVTYKASDIDLHCPVTLKVISEKYLADESARLRFLREARAAASVQDILWKECNRRLFRYYRTLAPQLLNSFREMEPLFSAGFCGCNAGLFREALHQVYIPRIHRGNAFFAANVLGARGPLLSVLAHFFERGCWGSLVETGVEGQSLSAEHASRRQHHHPWE
jgi:hypothetical protein